MAATRGHGELAEWGALSRTQRDEVGLLDLSDNDPPSYTERLQRYLSEGHALRGHTPLFGLERGRVVARATALRLTVTTGAGPVPVLGIADVVTRPDRLGRGWATRLLRAHHERARREGIRWALLWTHRSWGAHRAYEKLGYADLYSPPVAVKRVRSGGGPRLPNGFTAVVSPRLEAEGLERVLEEANRGRVGFVPRPSGWVDARVRLADLKPSNVLLLKRRSRTVGYAIVASDKFQVVCREAVAPDPPARAALLAALERDATGRWLAFSRTTFLTESGSPVRERGFSQLARVHGTLMASPLGEPTPAERRAFLATFRSRAFVCHSGDMF